MVLASLKNWLASRSRKEPATGIILHASGGDRAEGAIEWLKKIGLSYHYIIDRDGRITKLVPLSRVAFHAGVSSGWDGQNCNEYTIGICLANLDGCEKIRGALVFTGKTDPYPKAQVDACRELIAALVASDKNLKYISTHKAIAPKRKVDPWGFKVFDVTPPVLSRWRV